MNIDAFVTIFKGENYDEEMFYDLSINGLVQIRENVWEHEKTREKYVFTISPFGYVTRVEKLTGNELIKLPNSNTLKPNMYETELENLDILCGCQLLP